MSGRSVPQARPRARSSRDTAPTPHRRVTAWVFSPAAHAVPAAARLLALAVAAHLRDVPGGTLAWPKDSTLQAKLGVTGRQLRRLAQELEASGHWRVVRRRGARPLVTDGRPHRSSRWLWFDDGSAYARAEAHGLLAVHTAPAPAPAPAPRPAPAPPSLTPSAEPPLPDCYVRYWTCRHCGEDHEGTHAQREAGWCPKAVPRRDTTYRCATCGQAHYGTMKQARAQICLTTALADPPDPGQPAYKRAWHCPQCGAIHEGSTAQRDLGVCFAWSHEDQAELEARLAQRGALFGGRPRATFPASEASA